MKYDPITAAQARAHIDEIAAAERAGRRLLDIAPYHQNGAHLGPERLELIAAARAAALRTAEQLRLLAERLGED